MTEQHPLTDEICLAIDDNSMIDEADWKGFMRAGADWQLEKVIAAWEQCLESPRTDIQDLLDFGQKLKAMRPQQPKRKTNA